MKLEEPPIVTHILPGNCHHLLSKDDNGASFFSTYANMDLKIGTQRVAHKFYMPNIDDASNTMLYSRIIDSDINLEFPVLISALQWVKFIWHINRRSRIIICHSVFVSLFNFLPLFFSRNMRSKFVLVFWGGDLTGLRDGAFFPENNIISIAARKLLKVSLKRVRTCCTLSTNEIQLARMFINKRGRCVHLGYRFYEGDGDGCERLTRSENEYVNVQIGNSAAESNNHIEVLKSMAHLKNINMKVFCPLSYGVGANRSYVDQVITCGKAIFGDRFVAMLDILPANEYIEHLNAIDILVFNQQRQQGLFNSNYVLSRGKKLYLRSDSGVYRDYKNQGLIFFDTLQLTETRCDQFTQLLSEEAAEVNITTMKTIHSSASFREKWQNLLDAIIQQTQQC
ncbi:MAG: TDP-N-acetylfucosamine:lipid II N-acetylfucosaminyltransferase [Kiritimatiellae bacterium]|nr:TDP-N-acetylfucosamine:lipid II N-acetylfucosaminyltransferase [Kiritimatiellia bacterium]